MSKIAEFEDRIDKLRPLVERRDLVIKVEKNRDFRKLILEEFCVNECARYAQLSADPSLSPEERADALSLAQAAGHLRRWLNVVVRMGDQAEHDISQHKEAIEDIRLNGEE